MTEFRKPAAWYPINPTLVDPAWRWAWSGLVFALPLWEGGGPIHDIIGKQSGELAGVGTRQWETDSYGHGIDLDDGYVSVAGANVGAGDLSVLLVVKIDTLTAYDSVIYKNPSNDPSGNREVLWQANTTTNGWLDFGNNGGNDYGIGGGAFAALTLGEWITIVIRRVVGTTTGTASIWQNGIQLGSKSDAAFNSTGTDATPWNLGRDGANDPDCHYALVMAWNRALSNGEIVKLSRDPFGPIRLARQTSGRVWWTAAPAPSAVPIYQLVATEIPANPLTGVLVA